MTPADPPLPTRCAHIALVGAPNVGKSTLLNALVGEHLALVSPKAQATRMPVVGVRTEGPVQLIFHDTPGLLEPKYLLQRRMRAAALRELESADLILHLHPAAEYPAPPLQQLVPEQTGIRAPVLTVYTKLDLASTPETAAGGHWISAETGAGLPALIAELESRAPAGEFQVDPDELGTQPMRFFVVEYLREAAFEMLEDEVPYAFTAEVEEFREHTTPVYIRATLYVERDSQKGIVIGQRGQTLKAIGTHARTRLEALLGTKVYLDCHLKVEPRWRKDPDILSRWGFPAAADESNQGTPNSRRNPSPRERP
ncbi:MAG: GTPase Era [Gemmatimonadota bacterium]